MYRDAFKKFFWGFIFVLVGFRIKGFEILFPSIIGYIFIFQGLRILKDSNERLKKASKLIIPVMILSLAQIYQPDANSFISTGLGLFLIVVSITDAILHLMLMYNILMGIGDLAYENHKVEISLEAEKLWKNYIIIIVLAMVVAFLAGISAFNFMLGGILLVGAIVLLIATIVITVKIIKFMEKCELAFQSYEQS